MRSPEGNGDLMRSLVVGAGEAGTMLVRALRSTPSLGLLPVGFLDDDPGKKRAQGLAVLGPTSALARVASERSIDVVIIAIPRLPPAEIRRLGQAALAAGASVRYLPSFVAALERDARISDLRRLRVSDLLGRSERHVVRATSRDTVAGKRVLVTGAGGSIGTELCRQVACFGPAALYMLDHDESNLHGLQLQLEGHALLDSDRLIIADIRDAARIRQVLDAVRPQVVFHAAAHKHLPLLELHPCEAVKSNVMGTANLVDAAVEFVTERFILISTDKAADPTSVLGATKRLAEMIVQRRAGGATRLASVRFGNVLGSRGSFLATLSGQLENGEPVTVTHPDVTRFFMTVEEAVGLVLEAASMAETGEVFVLDMGDPVRILDLVREFAAQLHVGEDDLDIRFTGLRPGEKLNECLFSSTEQRSGTSHPRIWSAHTSPPGPPFAERLQRLLAAADRNRSEDVRRELAALLAGYQPSEKAEFAGVLAAPYPDGF
jgi:FlaA1/EpsC-like NDP-sugar epimerase